MIKLISINYISIIPSFDHIIYYENWKVYYILYMENRRKISKPNFS